MAMDSVLMELCESIKLQNIQNIKINLQTLLTEIENVELNKTDEFEYLLNMEDEDIILLTVKNIAELAKSEGNRKLFTKDTIIHPVMRWCKMFQIDRSYYCVRALGNICYENEEAREIIGLDGVKIIIDKLNTVINDWEIEDNAKYTPVLCGCLLNILMSSDSLQKGAINYDVLPMLEKILFKLSNDLKDKEDCVFHLLQILSFIVDQMVDQWITEKLCCLLVEFMRKSENIEIFILCLEILKLQLENDVIKLCLAKQGTCELIYELVVKYGNEADDEESRTVLKMACDLIVFILTGDDSMNLLFKNGNGEVYKQMVSWIDSHDLQLVTAGVLAIGNFARNDSHCIYMVESGLSTKLLGILSKHSTTESDVNLQHALLSALKHLSIPSQNKSKLIEQNIVEILYSMINIDRSQVIFKLIATLRMLVDGQEKVAMDLITRKEFIEKIVYWYYNSDHLGVHAEAPRLLVWLIKNCHSTEPYTMILSVPDIIKCLVEMISSMHAIMQNEALLALNLICTSCLNNQNEKELHSGSTENIDNIVNDINLNDQPKLCGALNLPELFVSADVGKNITFIIKKYHEKMAKETISNLLLLLEQLTKSTYIVEHLKTCGINENLLLLSNSQNASNFGDKISLLMSTCEMIT